MKNFLLMIFILAIFFFVLSGCQYSEPISNKDNLEKIVKDDGNYKIIVFVAGYYRDPDNQTYAGYWKNGEFIDLQAGYSSLAYSIFVYNNDVYIAGYYNDGGMTHACYWKNGVLYPLDGPLGTKARRILVVSGNVYIAGDYSSESYACYWENGQFIPLEDSVISWGRGLYIEKKDILFSSTNDVYVSGFITNGSIYPAYWKNGKREKVLPSAGATSTNLAVLNENIYVVTILDYGVPNDYLGLYKNDDLTIWDGVPRAMGYDIATYNGDIYISGLSRVGGIDEACYWKNTSKVFLTSGSGTSSSAYSIFLYEGEVYTAGKTDTEAYYSKGSEVKTLFRPVADSRDAIANSIYVVRLQ